MSDIIEHAEEQEQEHEQLTDEVVVTIGDPVETETPEEHQPAPEWVRKLRQQNRELNKELRETRQKLNQAPAPAAQPSLGAKPTLEDCGYDATRFENELAVWYESKRKSDERAAAIKAEEEQVNQKWNEKRASYEKGKTTLGVSDYEDAESVILDLLNSTQQGIIVAGSKDPALVMYAIGKNETEAKALAAIKDPVEFAFAVARLEGKLKVTSKKPTTAPEGRVSGNSRPSGATDHTLDRLRAEAEKTGDYTKVSAYKRQKRA